MLSQSFQNNKMLIAKASGLGKHHQHNFREMKRKNLETVNSQKARIFTMHRMHMNAYKIHSSLKIVVTAGQFPISFIVHSCQWFNISTNSNAILHAINGEGNAICWKGSIS